MSQEEHNQDAGELSSDESDLDLLLPGKLPASAKAQQHPKRPPDAVSYEALQARGFDGGPSLMEASKDISRAREEQKERERAAAEEAAKKQAEEEAAEEAARQQRKKIKHQSPADSLQQKERIVTQAEARGAVLRAQAAAQMESKYDFGQALDTSIYAGAGKREAERAQARGIVQIKRQRKDA